MDNSPAPNSLPRIQWRDTSADDWSKTCRFQNVGAGISTVAITTQGPDVVDIIPTGFIPNGQLGHVRLSNTNLLSYPLQFAIHYETEAGTRRTENFRILTQSANPEPIEQPTDLSFNEDPPEEQGNKPPQSSTAKMVGKFAADSTEVTSRAEKGTVQQQSQTVTGPFGFPLWGKKSVSEIKQITASSRSVVTRRWQLGVALAVCIVGFMAFLINRKHPSPSQAECQLDLLLERFEYTTTPPHIRSRFAVELALFDDKGEAVPVDSGYDAPPIGDVWIGCKLKPGGPWGHLFDCASGKETNHIGRSVRFRIPGDVKKVRVEASLNCLEYVQQDRNKQKPQSPERPISVTNDQSTIEVKDIRDGKFSVTSRRVAAFKLKQGGVGQDDNFKNAYWRPFEEGKVVYSLSGGASKEPVP